jgi:hypothetical protein
VKERTGRPVVVDAHPKHAISLGAAQAGWQILNSATTSPSVLAPPPAPPTSAPSIAAVMPPSPTAAAALAAPSVSAHGATTAVVAPMRSKRTALMVGGGVAAIALVLGVLALTRQDNSAASSGPSTSAPTATSAPVTTAPSTTPPTTVVQTTLAPTTVAPTTVPVAPPAGPTQNVADSTGSFIVSLPAGMATNTSPLTLSGVSFAHVSGSADLAGYLAGTWGSNGISVLAADASMINASQAAALLSPGASCTSTSGEQPYTTPQGNGVLVEYNGCGGGAFAETIIAVNVPAANATVLVGGTGQAPSSAGLTSAIETVLASVRSQ